MKMNNFSDDINRLIDEAVDSMDFRRLNREINKTMRKAVFGGPSLDDFKLSGDAPDNRGTFSEKQTSLAVPISSKPKGTVSGILMMSLGISCASAFVTFLGMSAALGGLGIAAACGILTGASLLLTGIGAAVRARVKRFRGYVRKMTGHEFFEISELAKDAGKKPDYVRKDLKKMIESGMFLEGHIDDSGQWFIGNNATYKEYMAARDSYEKRRDDPGASYGVDKLRDMLSRGEEQQRNIRLAKADILDPEVIKDLEAIDKTLGRIFERIEEKPELLPETDKLMEYYLPMTVKLVHIYGDFESNGVKSDEVTEAMSEIRETLGNIATAFVKLLEELYKDDAMDAYTDISVLKQMLAKDGLTEDDFSGK